MKKTMLTMALVILLSCYVFAKSGSADNTTDTNEKIVQDSKENIIDTAKTTEVPVDEVSDEETSRMTQNENVLSFDSNATTGFLWSGFVLSGDCVELDSTEGTYVLEENKDGAAGVGGRTEYTLTPLKPGRAILKFVYARSWEPESAEKVIVLVDVDEDLNITATDITATGMMEGVVTAVDKMKKTITIDTETSGEITAVFSDELELPVKDEKVIVYTDGVMTMSLPPLVNVYAWETVPSEMAKSDSDN